MSLQQTWHCLSLILILSETEIFKNQFGSRRIVIVSMQTRSQGMPTTIEPVVFPSSVETTGQPHTDRVAALQLPVYCIMGHSSHEVIYREALTLDESSHLTLEACSSLPMPPGCFSLSFTPAGAWGLVAEEMNEEDDDSFINWSGDALKRWFFLRPREVLQRGDNVYVGKKLRPTLPSVISENMVGPDKTFEFFGDSLSGGGFGVVEICNDKTFSQATIGGIDHSKLYNCMDRMPELRSVIKEANRTESVVSFRTIMRILGPGLYINTACSNLNIVVEKSSGVCSYVPHSFGRPLVADMYEKAYEYFYRTILLLNVEWLSDREALYKGMSLRERDSPTSCYTFDRDDGTDFSPVLPRREIWTRSMYALAQESHKKHPMEDKFSR